MKLINHFLIVMTPINFMKCVNKDTVLAKVIGKLLGGSHHQTHGGEGDEINHQKPKACFSRLI